MCLKVFVNGDKNLYSELKAYAMSLGSAFQKVNLLRDLKQDHEGLNRAIFQISTWKILMKAQNLIF